MTHERERGPRDERKRQQEMGERTEEGREKDCFFLCERSGRKKREGQEGKRLNFCCCGRV